MVRQLKTLLAYSLKVKQPRQKAGGFTLIELLVGLLLAFLVILPLIGFMVNILQTDRQEQAKATSQQEIQAALSYISRDLEQAVYIYDGFGLDQIRDSLPTPTGTSSTPVLVFWKRKLFPQVLNNGDDAFVYSLVAYYLTKETNCATSTWSCTAQIRRVEMHDRVPNTNVNAKPQGFLSFAAAANNNNSASGSSGQLEENMNQWAEGTTYSDTPEVLIDYIDHTPESIAGVPQAVCSTDGRGLPRPDVPNPQPDVKYENVSYPYRKVPTQASLTAGTLGQLSGFYACVSKNTEQGDTAQVFIRGNALARLRKKTDVPNYSNSQAAYFPNASIQVKTRGFLASNN